MRLEQRIGRIHRIGQTHEVVVFNFSARNTLESYLLDVLARKIRMSELVVGELDLILGGADDAEGFEQRVQKAWERAEDEGELKSAIERLSPEYREVLLLWGVEGLKYREIAAIVDVPIGTVMSRLHRARTILARQLSGFAGPSRLSKCADTGEFDADGPSDRKE